MAHNRKFVPGVVALVMGEILNSKATVFIQDEIEKIMIEGGFLEGAPFKWIGLIYRLGIKNKLKPEYQRINKKYGDLPIAVELDMEILKWADQHNLELLKSIFMIAGLEALIDVARKYHLPINHVAEKRASYDNIPETIEECIAWTERHQSRDLFLDLYEEDPEGACKYFKYTMNRNKLYEDFKTRIPKIPPKILEALIDMTLARSSFHQQQCEEIR